MIRIRSDMKKYLCALVCLGLLAACEQKSTTVTQPESEKVEKKETNTTVVNPPEKKTEKTEVDVKVSPSP